MLITFPPPVLMVPWPPLLQRLPPPSTQPPKAWPHRNLLPLQDLTPVFLIPSLPHPYDNWDLFCFLAIVPFLPLTQSRLCCRLFNHVFASALEFLFFNFLIHPHAGGFLPLLVQFSVWQKWPPHCLARGACLPTPVPSVTLFPPVVLGSAI